MLIPKQVRADRSQTGGTWISREEPAKFTTEVRADLGTFQEQWEKGACAPKN